MKKILSNHFEHNNPNPNIATVDGVQWEYQPDQSCWTNDAGEVSDYKPVGKGPIISPITPPVYTDGLKPKRKREQ